MDHFFNTGIIRRCTDWTVHERSRSTPALSLQSTLSSQKSLPILCAIIYQPITYLGRTRSTLKSLHALRLKSIRAGTESLATHVHSKHSGWRNKASKHNELQAMCLLHQTERAFVNETQGKESLYVEHWNANPCSWKEISMGTQVLSIKIQWHIHYTWKIASWPKGVMN